MTREIKFRAWDLYNKKMVDVGELGDIQVKPDLDFANYEVMQFTGLKDKNGKEIYEGDIIRYKSTYYGNQKIHTTLIEWKDDLEHDGFGEPLAMGYIFHGIENEVIGNIYQNPNLLNKEK